MENNGNDESSLNITNEYMSLEDKMLEAFAGKNAPSLLRSKLNWIAAITGQAFGPIWFFFRKCPLIGLGFIVITIIVGKIATDIDIKEASYIMFIIYLIAANPIYVWNAKRKIAQIIRDNPNSSEDALIAISKEKGGTSVIAVVIYGIVFVIIAFLYIMLLASAISYMYGTTGV